MAQTRPDRRVRRTRGLLHRALMELMVEKGYDHVTVQDILDRADVGRSTFYTHFAGKDELLLSGLDDLRAALAEPAASRADGDALLAPLRALFDHVAEMGQVYRPLLASRAAAVATRAGHRMLSDVLTNHLRARLAVTDEYRLELAVAFLLNGLIGLPIWWLDTHPDQPAEQLFRGFEQLATQGLETFLTTNPEPR